MLYSDHYHFKISRAVLVLIESEPYITPMMKPNTIILLFSVLFIVSCNVNRPISPKNTTIEKFNSPAQKVGEQNNISKKAKPLQAYVSRDITVGTYFKLWIRWRVSTIP